MAEPLQPKSPAEEMVKLWQAWMSAGMEAMQRTARLFAPGGGPGEWTAALPDQVQKAMRAALEAAGLPSAQDLRKVMQELGALRAQVEAVRTGLAALDLLVKGQQAMWQALEGSVQQATRAQREIQQAMADRGKQWEDRMAGLIRGLEEWRRRWDEMLRQATVRREI